TPLYGGTGVALSTVAGTAIGTAYYYFEARKQGVFVERKTLILTLAFPYLIGLFSYFIHLHWVAAMLLLGGSYLIYIKTKIITTDDLREIARALLGKERASLIYQRLKPVLEPLLE
ncbi:MAG: hypothetical protein ACP5GN_04240, partial [Fervidicoccaceae archaeon]